MWLLAVYWIIGIFNIFLYIVTIIWLRRCINDAIILVEAKSMGNRLSGYFAASNKNFAINFPAALICAVALWYLLGSFYWVIPAIFAVIEAAAKIYEIVRRSS